MKRNYIPLLLTIVVLAAIVVVGVRRHYQKKEARESMEYKGKMLVRKPAATEPTDSIIAVPVTERDSIKHAGLSPKMVDRLLEAIDSFLSAYSRPAAADYVAFRFQKTSEPWTEQMDPERLKQQLPMWRNVLPLVSAQTPKIAEFSLLIDKIRGYRDDADGTLAFCLPCITGWEIGTLSLESFTTNTIESGFIEMAKAATLNSKNTGSSAKPTFLAYPKNSAYPTAVVSFVVNTLRPKGKQIIALQLVWLPRDQQWIAVGIGMSPSDGWIAFPF